MSADIHRLPTDAERLRVIKTEIDRELATHTLNTLESAIRIGEYLFAAKKIAGRGNFKVWVVQNFRAGPPQASRYMKAVSHADELRAKVASGATFQLNAIPALLRDGAPPRPRKPYKQRERKPNAKILKALDALRAAGPEGMTPSEMAKAGDLPSPAGLDREVTRGTAVRVDGRFYAPEFAPNQTPPELPKTTQQKLEAWQRKLEADFEYRVKVEVEKRLDELHIPRYRERIAELTKMLERPRNAVMTKKEYNTILMCVHPDGAKRGKEDLEEAFKTLTKYKAKMYSDEASRNEVLRTLPATYEEMMARREKK